MRVRVRVRPPRAVTISASAAASGAGWLVAGGVSLPGGESSIRAC